MIFFREIKIMSTAIRGPDVRYDMRPVL